MAGCSTDVVILIVEELKGCNWGGIIRETLGGGGTGLDGSNGQEKLETTIGKP